MTLLVSVVRLAYRKKKKTSYKPYLYVFKKIHNIFYAIRYYTVLCTRIVKFTVIECI